MTRADDLIDAALVDALRELAENPMLLTTMAIVHQRKIGLPRERVKLYAEAISVLGERYQRAKGLKVSEALSAVLGSDRRLRPVLERLAFEAHKQQSSGATAI